MIAFVMIEYNATLFMFHAIVNVVQVLFGCTLSQDVSLIENSLENEIRRRMGKTEEEGRKERVGSGNSSSKVKKR